MSAEVLSILGVGVGLAALVIGGQRSIRADLRTGLAAASAERQAIRTDLHALAERVARLEGAFPFFAARILPDQRSENPPA